MAQVNPDLGWSILGLVSGTILMFGLGGWVAVAFVRRQFRKHVGRWFGW